MLQYFETGHLIYDLHEFALFTNMKHIEGIIEELSAFLRQSLASSCNGSMS